MAQRLAVVGAVLLASACTWGKFDDAEDNAPVVSLKKPGGLDAGFGVSLASVTSHGTVQLLVGGAAGVSAAAVYDLSRLGDPTVDAIQSGYCDPQDGCFLAARAAGVPLIAFSEEPHSACFAVGLHRNSSDARGVLLRCADQTSFTLPLPAAVEGALAGILDGGGGGPVVSVFDSDDREVPALAVATSTGGFAWVYPAGTADPVALVPAADDPSYGDQVAVLNTTGGTLVAVAAPDQAHVWLFREDGQALGCLGGGAGFGRSLAAGVVNADVEDDLVVADAGNVTVYDGAALAALPVTGSADCSTAALPEGALIASFGCGTTADLGGCAASDFGISLAVGDLDGDLDGEIAVGAPGLAVRGEARAGAVLLYDVEPEAPSELGDARFVASAESGDRLGSAVSLPRIGDSSVIAAGAPGAAKTLLFYCSRLIPGDRRAERCK